MRRREYDEARDLDMQCDGKGGVMRPSLLGCAHLGVQGTMHY